MTIELPAQPPTGIVTDGSGIEWRRNTADRWDPEPCSTCGTRPGGGLSWPELLQQRGPLTEANPAVLAAAIRAALVGVSVQLETGGTA